MDEDLLKGANSIQLLWYLANMRSTQDSQDHNRVNI